MRSKRIIEVFYEDGTIGVFDNLTEAGKALGVTHMSVYIMVAIGKARFIYRAEEGGVSYGALYQQGEEEVFYDALDQHEEEVFYDALDQQEWMKETFYGNQREWEETLKPPVEFFNKTLDGKKLKTRKEKLKRALKVKFSKVTILVLVLGLCLSLLASKFKHFLRKIQAFLR